MEKLTAYPEERLEQATACSGIQPVRVYLDDNKIEDLNFAFKRPNQSLLDSLSTDGKKVEDIHPLSLRNAVVYALVLSDEKPGRILDINSQPIDLDREEIIEYSDEFRYCLAHILNQNMNEDEALKYLHGTMVLPRSKGDSKNSILKRAASLEEGRKPAIEFLLNILTRRKNLLLKNPQFSYDSKVLDLTIEKFNGEN